MVDGTIGRIADAMTGVWMSVTMHVTDAMTGVVVIGRMASTEQLGRMMRGALMSLSLSLALVVSMECPGVLKVVVTGGKTRTRLCHGARWSRSEL